MRWATVAVGAVLVLLSFAATTRVADTREGMIAEVITLLGFGVGTGLLIYGLAARRRPVQTDGARTAPPAAAAPRPRTRKDLLLGAGGILLALILLTGLAVSGGPLWAGFGFALLLPMLAGSVYLCVRFLRASP